MKHSIKEIVKNGSSAKLTHVCEGNVFYVIDVEDIKYQLSIDSNDRDWKYTFLYPEMKTIMLMRWIRKGIEKNDDSFIQLN